MEEKNVLIENNFIEDSNNDQEKPLRSQPRTKNKEKECKVIRYDSYKNTLDVNFDGYGIRINNVKKFNGDTVIIKYKGDIGKPNFEYKI